MLFKFRVCLLPTLAIFLLPASQLISQDVEAPSITQENEAPKAEVSKDDDTKTEEADQTVLAGHSYHGEAFNDGPRQSAYLMEGTGRVSFPVTTKNEKVQAFVNQGIGQLHGFWYLESERSFRQAAALDPDCAMAYWGAAMATLGNEKRSKGFIAEAVKRKAKVSEREQLYIDLLNAYITADKKKKTERDQKYMKSLEDLILKYPDDLEAKAFLALHLYKSRSASSSYFAANALMEEIFATEPMHPTHHFRIHLWDNRKAEKALSSAAVCGQASPGIAHMWHMPGHIYSRLKRYDDACFQQEASARVDHAHMMRDRVLPDQIHNFAHNNEWLIRNLIFVGRVHDAVDLAKNMSELPQHPRYNNLSKRGSAYYGRSRLFQVLGSYEMWDKIVALRDTPYLEPTDKEDEQLKRLRLLGVAYYNRGDSEAGDLLLKDVEQRLAKQKEAEQKAVTAAEEKAKKEKKNDKDIEKAKANARKPFSTKIRNLDQAVNALKGHKTMAAGDAKAGYELVKKSGSVFTPLRSRYQWLAGEKDQAEKALSDYVNSHSGEILPLAHLAAIQWEGGKKDDAKKTFEKLRQISQYSDLDAVAFRRLAPMAKELGLPEDWRLEAKLRDDIGNRPELDTLGSFRWQPYPAPDWTLTDAQGNTRSMKQFQGKPTLVIFYLGYQCLHCAEQLQAFAPMMKDFGDAGISIVAISTDDLEGLKKSIDNYEGGPLPIPLLTNSELDVFKLFRAYDDFENLALHGTFLIDQRGLVRWQDISYEPFMDPKFVLGEAKRLLAQDSPNVGPEVADGKTGK
jgi:peroxiredoxin